MTTVPEMTAPAPMQGFPDPATWPIGAVFIGGNKYGYVYDYQRGRWDVVNGPHSGHVWVGHQPPTANDRRFPTCEGEFWYDLNAQVLMCYINRLWVPVGNSEEYLGTWRFAVGYDVEIAPQARP